MSTTTHRRLAVALFASAALVGAACSGAPRRVVNVPTPTPAPQVPPDSLVRIPAESLAARPVPALPPDSSQPITPPERKAERPAERCIMDVDGDRSQFIKDPISGKYTTYMGGGVTGRCRDQGITIIADSAESYEQSQLYFLIGNVHYREKRVALDADRISYFRAEERLLAEGNVKAVMSDSSQMIGPRAEYFRAVRGIRARPRIVATARPTLRLFEKDSIGRPQGEPATLIADNIVGEGDSLFTGWGRVEFDRSDIRARGDSMTVDNVRQSSRIMKQPFIESKGKDSFTLRGRVIDLFGRTRQVDRIVSTDSAVAVSRELTLSSDIIDLRVSDNRLQRAYAFGPGGASAVTRERTVLAESLDVWMPAQQIRELHAVRRAYAESDPDSTKIVSDERDWLRGDTIVAIFDSLPPTDTTSRPTIRSLVASGTASSLYQLANNEGEKDRPGLNYVRGRQIVVDFKQQEVQTVTVVDSASGVFLEATGDTASTTGGARRAAPAQGGQRRGRQQPGARQPGGRGRATPATRRPSTGGRRVQ